MGDVGSSARILVGFGLAFLIASVAAGVFSQLQSTWYSGSQDGATASFGLWKLCTSALGITDCITFPKSSADLNFIRGACISAIIFGGLAFFVGIGGCVSRAAQGITAAFAMLSAVGYAAGATRFLMKVEDFSDPTIGASYGTAFYVCYVGSGLALISFIFFLIGVCCASRRDPADDRVQLVTVAHHA